MSNILNRRIISFPALISIAVLTSASLCAQQKKNQPHHSPLEEIGTLPGVVPEASGLAIDSQKKLWTHNDGGVAALYCIDNTGKLVRTIQLNANNAGWEDLTKDKKGNFYVGAFGDNYNQKKDFKIYKIPDPASIHEEIINPEVIHYHYSDHESRKGRNHDMDAMTILRDTIFLFTKKPDRQGYVMVYKLPISAGEYTATLVDSIKVGGTDMQYWITGAATSPDEKKVLLLSHDKIFVLHDFKNAKFSSGRQQIISLEHFSHKAGICFYEPTKIFIVDELEFILGGKLYSLDLTAEFQKLHQ